MRRNVIRVMYRRFETLRALPPLPQDMSVHTQEMIENALEERMLSEIIDRSPSRDSRYEIWLLVHKQGLTFAGGGLGPDEVKAVLKERLDRLGIIVDQVAARRNDLRGPFVEIIAVIIIPSRPAT